MTAIPTENRSHVIDIARETLPEYARPDFRFSGRWCRIHLDENEATHTDALEMALREAGYRVTGPPGVVKATTNELHWPEVPDDDAAE